jgi:SSS family solute:Na+ symporter
VIIIIAIASIFFQKKQWVLGKRFGYITPSEMYGDYFKSKSLQLIIIFIAVLFVIPFAGLQIFLSGQLLSVISNNIINPISSSWIIGSIMCIYIALGGIKSVAYNNAIKFLLIIFGFLILGLISYNLTGGFTSLNINLAKLSSIQETGTE